MPDRLCALLWRIRGKFTVQGAVATAEARSLRRWPGSLSATPCVRGSAVLQFRVRPFVRVSMRVLRRVRRATSPVTTSPELSFASGRAPAFGGFHAPTTAVDFAGRRMRECRAPRRYLASCGRSCSHAQHPGPQPARLSCGKRFDADGAEPSAQCAPGGGRLRRREAIDGHGVCAFRFFPIVEIAITPSADGGGPWAVASSIRCLRPNFFSAHGRGHPAPGGGGAGRRSRLALGRSSRSSPRCSRMHRMKSAVRGERRAISAFDRSETDAAGEMALAHAWRFEDQAVGAMGMAMPARSGCERVRFGKDRTSRCPVAVRLGPGRSRRVATEDLVLKRHRALLKPDAVPEDTVNENRKVRRPSTMLSSRPRTAASATASRPQGPRSSATLQAQGSRRRRGTRCRPRAATLRRCPTGQEPSSPSSLPTALLLRHAILTVNSGRSRMSTRQACRAS